MIALLALCSSSTQNSEERKLLPMRTKPTNNGRFNAIIPQNKIWSLFYSLTALPTALSYQSLLLGPVIRTTSLGGNEIGCHITLR